MRSTAGSVIWITGLSGAGKSTLAHELVGGLRANGEPVVMLDGDELREVFGATAATGQPANRPDCCLSRYRALGPVQLKDRLQQANAGHWLGPNQ